MTDDSSPSYTLTPLSYSLPILHAAQHPSATTTGLFLAPTSSTSTSTSTYVEITNAIPLQHLNTSLTPYTELGLELVSTYAQSKGLKVVGMYICHAEAGSGKDSGLGRVGEKVLAKLKEMDGGAFALVLDNTKLAAGEGAFNVYLASNPSKAVAFTASSSSALPAPFTLDPSVPAKVLKAIREGKVHRSIKDLDDHLQDSSVDWLENKQATDALKTYIA